MGVEIGVRWRCRLMAFVNRYSRPIGESVVPLYFDMRERSGLIRRIGLELEPDSGSGALVQFLEV